MVNLSDTQSRDIEQKTLHNLALARDNLALARDDLCKASRKSNCVEGIIILDMIQKVTYLSRDVEALLSAYIVDRKEENRE